MSKRTLAIADLSAFTKSLRAQLPAASAPSHLALMNMLVRAGGHRNLQAFDAAAQAVPATRDAPAALPTPSATPTPTLRRAAQPGPQREPRAPGLTEAAGRALRQFDDAGRLMRWPSKFTTQQLALWALWPAFEPARTYTEREVNAVLNAAHTFGDPCTLRRELVTLRLLWRDAAGRAYRRLPARVPADAAPLLDALRARRLDAAATAPA